ncbi:MAG TPA: DUF5996 family protein [Longimicrobiaceae bacterium]|nr:DUF5996 family protein [Longimicrobiaceae bacterium]
MALVEPAAASSNAWPDLPYEAWKDTLATLHMWTQVVGKIRMAQAPPVNHWWHVPLYVSARGLTTSAIPYGTGTFELEFDFVDHALVIEPCGGSADRMPLEPRSVASFHREVMERLRRLGIEVRIWSTPVEVPDPIPFEEDERHASYDAAYVHRFWQALTQADRVLQRFRSPWLGKCSPAHFFWGSFDLALTRFSGRRAPPHPGAPGVADSVTREAYSHEVSSCGWWAGNEMSPRAAFYAYAYPEPEGFSGHPVRPEAAYYDTEWREFFLPYDAVRQADDPDGDLLAFLQTTYEAAAVHGGWDRGALER